MTGLLFVIGCCQRRDYACTRHVVKDRGDAPTCADEHNNGIGLASKTKQEADKPQAEKKGPEDPEIVRRDSNHVSLVWSPSG